MKILIKKIVISLLFTVMNASVFSQSESDIRGTEDWLNIIRKEKFDLILPEVMKENDIDMWMHVARLAIPDDFAKEELGDISGVFVFTRLEDGKIEKAALGRRWGYRWRDLEDNYDDPLEKCGCYDIIEKPIPVRQPTGSPMIEYDYRFKGLKEFVEARDPEKIAVNFMIEQGPWSTYVGAEDGISHTDYLLLSEEIGEKYSNRIVSSEHILVDYLIRKVPSEIELIKRKRKEEVEEIIDIFNSVKPGLTTEKEAGITIFRRSKTGESQRGRSKGTMNRVIMGGDILAAPDQGIYAYVLREGETHPPNEIQALWKEYLKINKILAKSIRSGMTPFKIEKEYKDEFKKAGILVRDEQLHMFNPKNNFPAYINGFSKDMTHLSIDCHSMRIRKEEKSENHGPRIGSYGPYWTKEIPIPIYHHFVLEYFFYMPCASDEYEDQYLFWWSHEQAIVGEGGVQYLSEPQKELYLIK